MAYDINKVREHFKVGNVIFSDYWRQYDRVLKFEENNGAWWVTVRGCDVAGKILPGDDGRERRHCTHPDKRDRIVCAVPQFEWRPAYLELLKEYAVLCNLDVNDLKKHIDTDPLGLRQFHEWAACLPVK